MSTIEAAAARVSDADLLHARYGADAAPAVGAMNEVLRQQLAHRSVRAYLPRPLPPKALETLVAAAQSAPSSSNLQAWSVVAIEDAGRKARLAQVAGGQEHVEQAPLFLAWIADLSRLQRAAAALGGKLEACEYLETFVVAAIDAALAAQNASVAAESMGLGTVFIGALRNDPERVAAELGLPPQAMAVFGLCVGYPDPAKPAAVKPRLPQGLVLHRERYAPKDEIEQFKRYDRTLAAFSRSQGLGDITWTGRVLGRFATLKGMNGRERMRAMMKALGFELC